MKLYIIEALHKYFYSEEDLLKYLAIQRGKMPYDKFSAMEVKTLNFEFESEVKCLEYLESSISKIEEISKISTDDGYAEKVHKFISEFERLGKDGGSKWKILTYLRVINPNKEEFSKAVKKHREYILYNVSNSVEWYSTVLDVCDFKKLEETCRTEYIHPVTKGTLWRGHLTPKEMIKNFEKAKKLKQKI